MKKAKKSVARLSPLECELCKFNQKCTYGLMREDMYRLGMPLRVEDCALYNGGELLCGTGIEQVRVVRHG